MFAPGPGRCQSGHSTPPPPESLSSLVSATSYYKYHVFNHELENLPRSYWWKHESVFKADFHSVIYITFRDENYEHKFYPQNQKLFHDKMSKTPFMLARSQSSKILQRYISHTSDIMKLWFKGKSIFVNVSWAKACSGKRRSDTNYKYYSQGKKVQICKK